MRPGASNSSADCRWRCLAAARPAASPGARVRRPTPLATHAGHSDRAGRRRPAAAEIPPPAGWRPLLCADRIRLCESGFHLLGRGTGVIKLEEKRISLEEVEGRLRALPWVREVAVLPLNVATRQQLGAVLVVTEAGLIQWQALGPGRFLIALREQPRPWLEPVALPRRLRLLPSCPSTARGSAPGAVEHYSIRYPWTSMPKSPPWARWKTQPAGRRHADKRAAHPARAALAGARSGAAPASRPRAALVSRPLPGRALLPGVVQVHWAMHYGRQLPGLAGSFAGMNQLKFQRPLRPGQECSCTSAGRPTRASCCSVTGSETSMPAAVGCGYVPESPPHHPLLQPLGPPGRVLAELHPWDCPCLLIDDGSEPGAAAALDALAEEHGAWLTLLRHDRNLGRGRRGHRAHGRIGPWASATGCR